MATTTVSVCRAVSKRIMNDCAARLETAVRRFLPCCLLVGWATACSPPATSNEPAPPTAARAPSAVIAPSLPPPAPYGGDEPDPSDDTPMPDPFSLFARYPALRETFPRIALCDLPTPLESHPELARAIGAQRLLLKRDDATSQRYGGGKPRKLELLLGQAQAEGRTSVVTFGGVGSNHVVATAMFASELGLDTRAFVLPQPPSPIVRENLLAGAALGVDYTLVGTQAQAERQAEELVAGAPSPADAPYVIPWGGTSPLGTLGFVNAGLELAAQLEDAQIERARVVVPMGTMGSVAGVFVGLRLAERNDVVIGARASNVGTSTRSKLDALVRATSELLTNADPAIARIEPDADLMIEGGYLGRGYARPTARGRAASALFQDHVGFPLELTYGAKAFALLVERASLDPSEPWVFWVTHHRHALDVDADAADRLPSSLAGYFH